MDKTFSKKMKEFRELKGWTQEDMYIHTGISLNSIKNWESGRNQPKIQNRKKLNDLFVTAGIDRILPTAKEVDDLLNEKVIEETAENIINSEDI